MSSVWHQRGAPGSLLVRPLRILRPVLGRIVAVVALVMTALIVCEPTGSTAATLNAPFVGMAAKPDGGGYWLVASDGGVFAYGNAQFYGSATNLHLNEPVVGMAATPDGGGYWLVAADGGVYAYGDAQFYGSAGGLHLNKPVVGMAAAPDGGGYWLVAADGGIFDYGDARFSGSAGGLPLTQPVVGMTATADGGGYWLVASDGGVFAYGDARFYDSAGGEVPGSSAVGIAASGTSDGYWLPTAQGRVFTFGAAQFYGAVSKIIALYGDSLANQSAQDFSFLATVSGATPLLRTFGGIAICDDLGAMASDASTVHPTVAVMEFSGDDQTPCMAGYTVGTPAYYQKYQTDAQTAINIFRSNGIPVILIGAPIDVWPDLTAKINSLNAIYASLASGNPGVSYVDAGQSVLLNGQYTKTLPCLPDEPCTGPSGTNVVRSPDGVHFCPDGNVSAAGVCDVYSSGAFRFATAMLGAALGQ
jgi:hypothetical protein